MNLKRGCNDLLCFVLFITFLGSMGFLTYYGYKHGNVAKLVAPLDADNNFCGQDNLEGYGLLYITNFNSIEPSTIFKSGVCVSKCPSKADGQLDCKTNS